MASSISASVPELELQPAQTIIASQRRMSSSAPASQKSSSRVPSKSRSIEWGITGRAPALATMRPASCARRTLPERPHASLARNGPATYTSSMSTQSHGTDERAIDLSQEIDEGDARFLDELRARDAVAFTDEEDPDGSWSDEVRHLYFLSVGAWW